MSLPVMLRSTLKGTAVGLPLYETTVQGPTVAVREVMVPTPGPLMVAGANPVVKISRKAFAFATEALARRAPVSPIVVTKVFVFIILSFVSLSYTLLTFSGLIHIAQFFRSHLFVLLRTLFCMVVRNPRANYSIEPLHIGRLIHKSFIHSIL
jgi:hypothetical protein